MQAERQAGIEALRRELCEAEQAIGETGARTEAAPTILATISMLVAELEMLEVEVAKKRVAKGTHEEADKRSNVADGAELVRKDAQAVHEEAVEPLEFGGRIGDLLEGKTQRAGGKTTRVDVAALEEQVKAVRLEADAAKSETELARSEAEAA
eukprot:scaffold271278_cov30-Tisochrysis_lutea.AAC.7